MLISKQCHFIIHFTFWVKSNWINFILFFSVLCKFKLPYNVHYLYFIFCHPDFFFCACVSSLCTHSSLLTFFHFFALFNNCCSHAWVFEKTLHELHISCTHNEWSLFFFFRGPCLDEYWFAYQKLIKLKKIMQFILFYCITEWIFFLQCKYAIRGWSNL